LVQFTHVKLSRSPVAALGPPLKGRQPDNSKTPFAANCFDV
jgi:hypothetical protein